LFFFFYKLRCRNPFIHDDHPVLDSYLKVRITVLEVDFTFLISHLKSVSQG
jgi:hypothetical protein